MDFLIDHIHALNEGFTAKDANHDLFVLHIQGKVVFRLFLGLTHCDINKVGAHGVFALGGHFAIMPEVDLYDAKFFFHY